MYLRKNKEMNTLKTLILIITTTLFFKCANISAPNGGPKDINIPILKSQYPNNKTLNFKDSKIILEFNENVTLNNANQEIQITPSINNKYKIHSKKKIIELTFTEQLKENTTYRINLNKSIKDITEGNVAQELTILFSTGNQLDSLYIEGNIINIKNNKNTDVIVGIYNSSDTLNIYKQQPYVYTKSIKGHYKLENLKNGEYDIIAFEDKNNNIIVDENEIFGFNSSTIMLKNSVKDLNINILNRIKKDSLKIKNTFTTGNKIEIEVNNGLTKVEVLGKDIVYSVHEDNKNINIYNLGSYKDSIAINLHLLDSNDNSLHQKILFKTEERKNKTEKATFNPALNTKIITNKKPIVISFTKPIIGLKENNIIKLYSDNNKIPDLLTINKDYTVNTYNDKILINNSFTAKDSIIIQIDNKKLKTINGDSIYSIKGKYLISDITETGTIQGKINTSQNSFIVQLLDNNYKVTEQIINTPNYIFTKIKPGKYSVRVINDTNNNGVWDLGNYKSKIQPESVSYYNEEITLKENWEVLDINIDLK
jgi:uncharacterized protein (DUF2141 family)